MVSEKQQQANIQNAQLSTGPITPEGKMVAAKNAVKHGIFARDLVINAGDGREDELEYQELLSELEKDLVPTGRMEILLVEKIAVNYWRMRRLVRYETGEIRSRLDDFRESALESYYSNSYYSRRRPDLEYFDYEDQISDDEYQEQTRRVSSMQNGNFDLAKERNALEYVLLYRMDSEKSDFDEKDYEAAGDYVGSLSPQMRGKLRREILDNAEQVLFEMDEVRSWRVKFDRIHKIKSLPMENNLNNIIKYENSLERSIFRNLSALKTLQENRVKNDDPVEDVLDLPVAAY
jgi:hypothetical protein